MMSEISEPENLKTKSLRIGRWWLILFPLFFLAVMAIAVWTGVHAGEQQRQTNQMLEILQASHEQFELGLQDISEGRLQLAKQRFEYVLSIDPNHIGATEMLDQVLDALNEPTRTPRPSITATIVEPTPTLDVRSLESLYQGAQDSVAREDWSGALNALILLRGEDPSYQLDEVNQMMAYALRNRGVQKILAGDREQGIFDLTLAERFGPLDAQAQAWKRSAAYYGFANSYFDLDWPQAVQHFAQLCQASIWDSCYKYAMAAMNYGDLLMAQEDPCAAVLQYEASLLTRDNKALRPTATYANDVCLTATAPLPSPTPTVTLTLETPTIEWTPPTSTNTPETPIVSTPTPTDTQKPQPPIDTPTATTSVPVETPAPTITQTPTPTATIETAP